MWKLDEDEEDDLDSPNIPKELKKKKLPTGFDDIWRRSLSLIKQLFN